MFVGTMFTAVATACASFLVALFLSLPFWVAAMVYGLVGTTALILGGPLLALVADRAKRNSSSASELMQPIPVTARH